jgi:hypothetical protein
VECHRRPDRDEAAVSEAAFPTDNRHDLAVRPLSDDELAEAWRFGGDQEARAARKEQARRRRAERHRRLVASVVPGAFAVVYADRKGGPLPDILPLHRDALVFLRTSPLDLPAALRQLDSWGVLYRGSLVVAGTGGSETDHLRMDHELILFARRGNPPTPHTYLRPTSVRSATEDVPALLAHMFPGWPLLVIRGAA